jgi:hypothetical protein
MSDTLTYSGRLVVTTCWCGMVHAVPEELRDYQLRQHRDGRTMISIYCPLGHARVRAGKGEAARLREKLEAEYAKAARLTAEADQLFASNSALKGAATKARKRAKAGVCPCCNRTFQQLARHMKSKHPNFDPKAV